MSRVRATPGSRPATVFLDRDGVLNRPAAKSDYVTKPEELELLEGAAAGVRLLNDQGILVLVVTNQRGIALGRMDAGDLERIHAALGARLAAQGAWLDGIYHCPHAAGSCECRKPGIGMFLQARHDHPEIAFDRSAVIGDSLTDMTAAARIGARGILVTDDCPPAVGPAAEPTRRFECAESLLAAARRLVE